MNPEEQLRDSTHLSLSDLDPFSPGQARHDLTAPSECLPEPLVSLLEAPVPAFLSKTFDLVEDPSLDPIISWAPTGESFVVWDPVDFSRFILPQNFKHSNFSSFVRQLNTYGFRKMHSERWEFANEGFLRGRKHLLRIIQRRKPSASSGLPLEVEIDKMKKERVALMQEVVQLQREHCGTVENIEAVSKKLQTAEEGQKQMVSFMARLLGQMKQMMKPEGLIDSPRTITGRKRFVKHGLKYPHNLEETGMDERVILCSVETEDRLPPVPEGKKYFASSSSVEGEDVWSTGLGDAAGMTSSSHELWGDRGDVWPDIDPLHAATSSDMEMWMGHDSSYGEPADYL